MNQTTVSVIICGYTTERLKDIHEAVDSVLRQTLKPQEVIVAVDHNEELFQRLEAELPPEVKVVISKGLDYLITLNFNFFYIMILIYQQQCFFQVI